MMGEQPKDGLVKRKPKGALSVIVTLRHELIASVGKVCIVSLCTLSIEIVSKALLLSQ